MVMLVAARCFGRPAVCQSERSSGDESMLVGYYGEEPDLSGRV